VGSSVEDRIAILCSRLLVAKDFQEIQALACRRHCEGQGEEDFIASTDGHLSLSQRTTTCGALNFFSYPWRVHIDRS